MIAFHDGKTSADVARLSSPTAGWRAEIEAVAAAAPPLNDEQRRKLARIFGARR